METLTAAAPVTPPAEFFEQPEADEPTPLTYEDDGRVYGHLALWGSCHTGFLNGAFAECVKPPNSRTDYAHFHLGRVRTAEGDDVRIGKITYATGHAPLRAGLQAASRHYDDTGSVGAFVRARDGSLGIWLSGVLRSDLSAEGLRDLRANPPSGDWRSFNHHLELIASLAVPVPGFPIPKVELALAASGEGTEVDALILPSWTVEQEGAAEMRSREYLRRRHALSAAVLTTERRNDMPRSMFAIPETRSYPIHDRAHAANALARSSGKPEAARVRRAVCRKYPEMPACKM